MIIGTNCHTSLVLPFNRGYQECGRPSNTLEYIRIHYITRHNFSPTRSVIRSRASRISIQLVWYARVLFSGSTVNFREPIDILWKYHGKCRGSQCVPRCRCKLCGRSLRMLFGQKLFEPQPSLTGGRTPIQRDPGCPATVLCGNV